MRVGDKTGDVRREYGVSIDRREAVAIERTLAGCASTQLVVLEWGLPAATRNTAERLQPRQNAFDALERWDANQNIQIMCAEARRYAIAPIPKGHPANRFMHDGDGDGVVCE